MKKESISLSFIALLSAAVSVTAVALDVVTYYPQSGDGPWVWNTADNWFKHEANLPALGYVPSSSQICTVYLVSPQLSEKPLQIPSGTAAYCSQMMIMTPEKTIAGMEYSDKPILLEVCGGAITNTSSSYLGHIGSNWGVTRSAKVDISSGSWTSLGDFNIGGGSQFSYLNIGENGLLTVTAAGKALNLGYANHGGVIVTNRGLIKARNIHLTHKYTYGQVFGSPTGIVYNAQSGNIAATNNFLLGGDTDAYAVIENFGTINVGKSLTLGNARNAVSIIENHGTIEAGYQIVLGNHSEAGMSVYRHKGDAASSFKPLEDTTYYVGYKSPALFSVDGGEISFSATGDAVNKVFIGYYQSASASDCRMEIVNGGKVNFRTGSISVGLGTKSSAELVIDGEGSELTGGCWINVGNWTSLNDKLCSGRGDIIVSNGGKAKVSAIYLGFGGGARGTLTVSGGSSVEVTGQLTLGQSAAEGFGASTGIVTVAGASSVITNVRYTQIGRLVNGIVNTGVLQMRGGRYFLANGDGERYFNLGANGNTSCGEINGYGRISHNGLGTVTMPTAMYMKHFGKVIADGEGEARDLDMRFMWAHGSGDDNPNAVGSNGWYARNKGRLRMPILRTHGTAPGKTRCVGDYIYREEDPRLVNSFKCTFSNVESTAQFLWADLFAPDRDDIPDNAHLTRLSARGKKLAIYRIGYFSDKYNFEEPDSPYTFASANLRFRYSAEEAAGYPRIRVYRHDGTGSGTWHRVGDMDNSEENPVVGTSEFVPSAAAWNLGYFAVVADHQGMVMMVR